jgi:hypothetical protein
MTTVRLLSATAGAPLLDGPSGTTTRPGTVPVTTLTQGLSLWSKTPVEAPES